MLIFGIILVVINFEFISGCKINYNFKRIAVAPGIVKICTDALCANSFSYFVMGVTYFACMWDTHVDRLMRIFWVARELRWGSEDYYYCLDNSAVHQWSTECEVKKEIYFVKNFGARQTDAFTLECGPWRVELPLSERPRIQVNPFYPRAVFLHYNLPVKISDNFYVEQICITTMQLKCSSYSFNCIQCVDSKCAIVSEDYPLCYANCFNWNMTLQVEKIDRKNIKMQLSSDNDWYRNNTYFPTEFDKVDVHNSVTCISTEFMVYIKREDENSTDLISSFDVKPNEPDKISIYCYLGIDLNIFKHNKIIIIRRTVTVLSKLMTKLLATRLDYNKSEISVQSTINSQYIAKYYTDTVIACANKSSTLYLNTLRKKVDLPLSQYICGNPNICITLRINVLTWKVERYDYPIFVRCYDGYGYQAPLILFTESAPDIVFYNTYPWYDTYYILPGFIFGCKSNKGRVNVECIECGTLKLHIFTFNDSNVAFSIPEDLDVDMDLKFICKVNLLDGMKFSISKSYILAGAFFQSLNIDQIIPVIGQNISCKKYFTLTRANKSQKAFTLEPIWMTVNQHRFTSIEPRFKIPGSPDENVSLVYTYCCPYLPLGVRAGVTDPYSLLECQSYNHITIAKTARVEYNRDLQSIYTGQTLRCFFCVNFSTDAYPVYECNSTQQVKSFISMNITNPGAVVKKFYDKEEVVAPIEELSGKGDEYYNIAEYEVKIKCKIDSKSYSPIINVKILNCNAYPPKLFVFPSDKTLLMVGHRVGCDVFLNHCKGKINYTISIINSKKEEFTYHQISTAFQRYHMGSNIKVQCSAGTSRRTSAYRFFRVVGEPQNIRITNGSIYESPSFYKKYFTHGDYFECDAEAFPLTKYEWSQTLGPSHLYTVYKYILIRQVDSSGIYCFYCTISNEYGTVSARIFFEVYINQDEVNKISDLRFQSMICLQGIIFIAVVLLCTAFIHNEILSSYLFYINIRKIIKQQDEEMRMHHKKAKTTRASVTESNEMSGSRHY